MGGVRPRRPRPSEEVLTKLKLKILLLSIVTLLPLGSALAAGGGGRDGSANFKAAVDKLRSVEVIGGSATGFTLAPGEFFKLSQELLRNGTAEEFKGLLGDKNPVVRVMGLVCLAQTDRAAYAEIAAARRRDRANVSYMIGCVIRHATVAQLADRLVENPFFFGREEGQLPPPASGL
jgi:hypothetical protein